MAGNAMPFEDLSPFSDAAPITTSDAGTINTTRGVYVGVAGDVTVLMANGSGPITFKAAPVGVLNINVRRVYATGTTATNLVALY